MQCHQEEAEIVILAHSHCKGGEKKRVQEVAVARKDHHYRCRKYSHPSIHPSGVGGCSLCKLIDLKSFRSPYDTTTDREREAKEKCSRIPVLRPSSSQQHPHTTPGLESNSPEGKVECVSSGNYISATNFRSRFRPRPVPFAHHPLHTDEDVAEVSGCRL